MSDETKINISLLENIRQKKTRLQNLKKKKNSFVLYNNETY